MNIRVVNPLEFPDWDEALLSMENHSIFHSSHWARVLVEAYGYTPLYFSAVEEGKLKALIPVMEVNSILTGRRGVSLPFTDFCEPLGVDGHSLGELNEALIQYGKTAGWRSMEWRGGGDLFQREKVSSSFYKHTISLPGEEEALASGLRSSTRRNIRKAQKEGIEVDVSRSLEGVQAFFRLNCITRKHHGMPPQPMRFFKKVFEHIISKDRGMVALGFHKKRVVSGCMYFHFGKNAIYKYGASDRRFQNLRANNLVMWEALRWYQKRGFQSLSLGRSEPTNQGLLQFKRGWSCREEFLQYRRFDLSRNEFIEARIGTGERMTRILKNAPIPVLRLIGAAVYRHVG
jgi:hypothetical protein